MPIRSCEPVSHLSKRHNRIMASELATEDHNYQSPNTSHNPSEDDDMDYEPSETRATSSSSMNGSETESQWADLSTFNNKMKERECSKNNDLSTFNNKMKNRECPKNNDVSTSSLIESLAAWAIEHNIQQKALNKLLLLLKTHPSLKGLPSDSRLLFQAVRTSPSTSNLEQKTHQIAEKQDKMEKTLQHIMKELKNVRGLVIQSNSPQTNTSKQTNGYVSINEDDEREFLKKFPVATLEDFFVVEEALKQSKEKRIILTRYLDRIGGFSLEESTRRIFVRLVTNEVALNFSYFGKKGKIPLHNLTLIKIVHDVMSSTHKDAPSKNIESRISGWFRQATTRQSYKDSKSKTPNR